MPKEDSLSVWLETVDSATGLSERLRDICPAEWLPKLAGSSEAAELLNSIVLAGTFSHLTEKQVALLFKDFFIPVTYRLTGFCGAVDIQPVCAKIVGGLPEYMLRELTKD